MTPKEKAEDLFCKMYGCDNNTDLNDIYLINADGYFIAKDSVLIAVDEIIKETPKFIPEETYIDDVCGVDYFLNEKFEYWQEVKNQINLL